MAMDNAVKSAGVLTEPLNESSGYCSQCRSAAYFCNDKELGYYKRCPDCGHIEYLHRRFLRFDRQSRQWQ